MGWGGEQDTLMLTFFFYFFFFPSKQPGTRLSNWLVSRHPIALKRTHGSFLVSEMKHPDMTTVWKRKDFLGEDNVCNSDVKPALSAKPNFNSAKKTSEVTWGRSEA